MIVLGIDPGSVSGAYAFMDTDDQMIPIVGDLPVANRMVDAAQFSRLVQFFQPKAAIVEQVSAMPKQGATSGFRFGQGVGIIHGVIQASGVAMHLVPASAWKKQYRLTSDKELSRSMAIRLFPLVEGMHLKKHHGRAEALLLAQYLRTQVYKL